MGGETRCATVIKVNGDLNQRRRKRKHHFQRILRVVSHFNLSVLGNETLSVSLCREINNGEHVLTTCYVFRFFVGAYSIFKVCMCQQGVMQIQVQIGDTRRVFFMNPPGSVEDLKENYILREIPRTRFMDFGLLYENNEGEYVELNDVRMAGIRLASLVYLPCLR